MKPEVSGSAAEDPSPTDGELVRRAQQGNQRAFDELIVRYQRQAVAVSYRLLGNVHDALEVTQNAFLKGFTSLGSLQNPDSFAGWLMRIVSNLSLNFRRGRATRSTMPLDELVEGPQSDGGWRISDSSDPVHELESREMGEKLREAMGQLPEKQRLALIMFTMEQMPQKQVADALECSVEAVKWHVFQGRKKLRELMKDYL
jgi:RNA polymerase sigma-70 factor, ECF subfamily